MTTLTDQEKKFLGILENAEGDSIWNIAIQNVIKQPEPWKVRRLICELKSQAADQPEIMQSIIGEPGLQQLQNL